ncbi:hypothetical protein TSST111916_02725 [Tsukamurella strandjordii]
MTGSRFQKFFSVRSSVLRKAIGTIGVPVASATRTAPVLPLYSRPSGERVPSGWMPQAPPSCTIFVAASSAGEEAVPPLRSTGICPMPEKKIFLSLPRRPGWVK